MAKPKRESRDLIVSMKREFRRVKKSLEPELQKMAAESPPMQNPEMRNVLIAQDAILPALAALMEELIPFSHLTALELGIRVASYILSVAPLEDQDKLVSLFMEAFPQAHQMRIALGAVISIEWEMGNGEVQLNIPQGPIVNPKGGI